MNTELIRNPGEQDIARAAKILREGGLVALPTETVYGLGGNALSTDAAKKIYAAKGRPSDNPLIVHLASREDAAQYCETNDLYDRLSKRFSPGPITMILKRKPCVPLEITGGLDTVAIRVPENEIARQLIRKAGVPIAAPSANTSGRPSPTTADHVYEDLQGKIEMILDGGDCSIGVESTIVKIDDGHITLLRPGAITLEMLREVDANISVDDKSLGVLLEGEIPLAPGMKYRHYAPRAKVIVLDGDRSSVLSYMREKASDPSVGILSDGEDMRDLMDASRCFHLGDGRNAEDMAKHLFAALREVDRNERIQTVYVSMPGQSGIGLAVYNRLLKAAGFTVVSV